MNEWEAKAKKSRDNKRYYESHKPVVEIKKLDKRAKQIGRATGIAARKLYRANRELMQQQAG